MTDQGPQGTQATHRPGWPPILYVGTPVVLISTTNPDGTANLAPMSSAWWLGWRAVLGLAVGSRTTQNLRRTGEAVLNLPHAGLAPAVDRLALTTGSDPVPPAKVMRGYEHESEKFGRAGLHAEPADLVTPPRVVECTVQMEVVVADDRELGAQEGTPAGQAALEVRVLRVHLDPTITRDGDPDRIDPDRWRPLIMSFGQFYGLSDHRVGSSRLAAVPEHLYRGADHARARAEL